jgi:aldose 1-epimerase
LLTLASGDLVVELAPEIGGSVASFRMLRSDGTFNLMRPMSEEARANRKAGGAAMFPMVPYANRFDFEGRTYQFQQMVPGELFAIHGTGWQSEWTISTANTASAELHLNRMTQNEPYSYSAFQRFCLSPDRLVVLTGVKNHGDRAMPFGFGQHPCWDRHPDVTLQFNSTHLWFGGTAGMATERIATPPELDFSRTQPLPRSFLDNCYGGWDGRAVITFPHSGVGLRMEANSLFRYLMLYCDPAKTFFCVEPQTHAAGALNHLTHNYEDSLGMLVLKPGESAEAETSFVPFEI